MKVFNWGEVLLMIALAFLLPVIGLIIDILWVVHRCNKTKQGVTR